MDVDIFGINEVDAISGSFTDAYLDLINMMAELGYGRIYHENLTLESGSCIFYRKDKISLVETLYAPFSPGAS